MQEWTSAGLQRGITHMFVCDCTLQAELFNKETSEFTVRAALWLQAEGIGRIRQKKTDHR